MFGGHNFENMPLETCCGAVFSKLCPWKHVAEDIFSKLCPWKHVGVLKNLPYCQPIMVEQASDLKNF